MTLWHPDTCNCQITISDAQDTPDYGEPIEHLKVCSDHARLGHDHKAVLKENQRKNIAHNDAQEAYPGVKFVWSFDKDRTLILQPVNGDLVGSAKQSLQAQLESKHGAGKVKVI